MPTRNTIFQSTAVLQDFDAANPIDFNLYDDEGRQQIYILNDQSPGRQHHLVLVNNSENDFEFEKPASVQFIPSRVNYHFELRFRPGTLDPEYLNWLSVGTGGWRLGFEEHKDSGDDIHDGTVSLYFLFIGQEDLTLKAGKTQVIILNHVKAGIPGGSRGSRMELHFQTNLHSQSTDKKLFPSPAPDLVQKRQERLQIVNNRGVKDLPMKVGFEGSSTVLNDGSTPNNLSLQLSNFLHNSTIELNGRDSESPTKFILSFDTSETDTAWALCDDDNAKAINVFLHFDELTGTSWHIRAEFQGENPQWIITLIDDIPIKVGEFFHLHLDGIISSMPSGFTYLFLLYENIPGYWDGCFKIPIEKSPLKFDDQKHTHPDEHEAHDDDGHFIDKTKVGIGNTEPQDTLDVNGGIQAENLVLRNGNSVANPLDVTGNIKAGSMDIDTELNVGDKKLTQSTAKIGTAEFSTLKVDGRLADSEGFLIPPGGIIMWSGTDVPDGWKLCDGQNNTPDLRSRFIVGAGQGEGNDDRNERLDNYTINTKGGRKQHQLTTPQLPNHQHPFSLDFEIPSVNLTPEIMRNEGGVQNPGENLTTETTIDVSINAHSGEVGNNLPHENRPPYFVLAFIMKK